MRLVEKERLKEGDEGCHLKVAVQGVKPKRAEEHAHEGVAEIRLQVLIRADARNDGDAMLISQAHRTLSLQVSHK